MKEIVISINPEWVEKIFQLRKTWELRTTKPMCPTPFRCFIYKTGNGGVVGEFTCDQIEYERSDKLTKDWLKDTEVSLDEAKAYSADRIVLYKWRIRSIVEYPSPRPLSLYGLDRPPQGWCYAKGSDPGVSE